MRGFPGGLGRLPLWLIIAVLLMMALQQAAGAAGPARYIDFRHAPTTTEAGQCSDGITIGVYDLSGNLTTADRLIPVTLHASRHVSFYAESACSNPVTSVAIWAGSRSVTFYVKNPEPETVMLVGTAGTYGSVVFPLAITPAATPASAAAPVNYNPQWLVAALVCLTIVGGFVLRKRMSWQ